jgi:hypothetical protein
MKTKVIKNINLWLPIVALLFVVGSMGFNHFKDLKNMKVFQTIEGTPGADIKKIEFVQKYESGLKTLERLQKQKVEQIEATKESQKRYERTLAMYPGVPVLEIDKPINYVDSSIDININYWIEYLEENKARYEALKDEAPILLAKIEERQNQTTAGKIIAHCFTCLVKDVDETSKIMTKEKNQIKEEGL